MLSYILLNDCRLYYSVQGQGTPILFIHPPVLTHFNFEYQMKELSKHFQVITFDIRGHGRSSSSETTLTYPLIVKDMKHILDHLKVQQAFICGYSAGGSIALEFLLSNAEYASGGIIISGMSEVSDWYLKNKITIGIALAKCRVLSALSLYTSLTNTTNKSSFLKMLKDEKLGTARNVEEYYRYSLNYNCTNKLGKINVPIFLIYGQNDRRFYRYAELLHEHLPNSELKWIHNAKHQLPTKAACELNHLIKEFITKQKEI